MRLAALLSAFLCFAGASAPRADTCLGPVARAPDGTPIARANLTSGELRLTYIGHSTFTIETPGGVVAATDYNDYVRPVALPQVATMNHAHSTHFTPRPDPAIRHVLRGWSFEGQRPNYDIREGDLRVRNVPTNIRAGWGDGGGTELYGNSIFIFEAAGLCIAHLGHLHHTLTPEHLKAIGQMDVVLAPVDGSWTMDLDGMVEVIRQLNPKLVVPMHFIGQATLQRFLDRMAASHRIERPGTASTVLSFAKLPKDPAIMVLQGY